MPEADECELDLVGRSYLVFRRGSESAIIEIELLSGRDHDYVLFADSLLQWRSPAGTRPISKDERRTLLAKAVSILSADGIRVIVEEREGLNASQGDEDRSRRQLEAFDRTLRMLRG